MGDRIIAYYNMKKISKLKLGSRQKLKGQTTDSKNE
jgi:hypothetical protein